MGDILVLHIEVACVVLVAVVDSAACLVWNVWMGLCWAQHSYGPAMDLLILGQATQLIVACSMQPQGHQVCVTRCRQITQGHLSKSPGESLVLLIPIAREQNPSGILRISLGACVGCHQLTHCLTKSKQDTERSGLLSWG